MARKDNHQCAINFPSILMEYENKMPIFTFGQQYYYTNGLFLSPSFKPKEAKYFFKWNV